MTPVPAETQEAAAATGTLSRERSGIREALSEDAPRSVPSTRRVPANVCFTSPEVLCQGLGPGRQPHSRDGKPEGRQRGQSDLLGVHPHLTNGLRTGR